MKKIISLVAIVGVFVLMSFGMDKQKDCWTIALMQEQNAILDGATASEADEVFHDAFENCAEVNQIQPL